MNKNKHTETSQEDETLMMTVKQHIAQRTLIEKPTQYNIAQTDNTQNSKIDPCFVYRQVIRT